MHKDKVFTLRMDEALFDRISTLAALHKRSVAKEIEFAVRRYVEQTTSRDGSSYANKNEFLAWAASVDKHLNEITALLVDIKCGKRPPTYNQWREANGLPPVEMGDVLFVKGDE